MSSPKPLPCHVQLVVLALARACHIQGLVLMTGPRMVSGRAMTPAAGCCTEWTTRRSGPLRNLHVSSLLLLVSLLQIRMIWC